MGGIANYYKAIGEHLSLEYEYIFRGNANKHEPRTSIPWRLLKDYFTFYKNAWGSADAIVINSSLGSAGFFRDGLYFWLIPGCVKKTVFFHGWDPEFEEKVDKSVALKAWLEKTFLKADHIIVLSSEFKNKLLTWGYKRPVSVQTTLVDEGLLDGETYDSISEFRSHSKHVNSLYLGNVSKAKGVWEIIKAIKLLKSEFSIVGLITTIAGDGKELEALRKYSTDHDLSIEFPGYVRDKQKLAIFKNTHLYVFPSAHEGMPLSVLEAMAFGLPVITTRVGGIPDFFEDGKMGLFLDNRKPEHIAEKITYLLDRPELMKQMSEYNFHYAREHFYSSKVTKRLEDIVNGVIEGKNE